VHRLFQRFVGYFGAHRVEGRDEHERDRARQRIGIAAFITTLVAAHQLWMGSAAPLAWVALGLSLAYGLVAWFHLRWVLGRAQAGVGAQYLFIVLDSVMTVAVLVGAPQVLGPLYPLLIVQVVRCGMRYGVRTFWLAWGSAAVTAVVLMPFSPFWLAERLLLTSFVFTMVIIPVLTGPLIRRLHDAQRALADAAGTDPLTGAGNRRLLAHRLALAEEDSRQHGTLLALLLVDLDNFKRVNDALGHNRGDELLVQVVRRMQARCRASDFVGRVGGDELVLLMQGLPADSGVARARELADALVEEVRVLAGLLVPGHGVSASAGVACWAPHHGPALSMDELLKQADEAMYAAKRAGKSRSVLAAAA